MVHLLANYRFEIIVPILLLSAWCHYDGSYIAVAATNQSVAQFLEIEGT